MKIKIFPIHSCRIFCLLSFLFYLLCFLMLSGSHALVLLFAFHSSLESLQCLKCRHPVTTIAILCLSASAITSASATDPPVWMIALTPALAAA